MYKVKLTIGDWSKDGHEKSDYFIYMSSHTVEELREAYKMSCRKLGIQFNSVDGEETNFIGADLSDKSYIQRRTILTSYRDLWVPPFTEEAFEILKKADLLEYLDPSVKFDELDYPEPDEFAELIMKFIKISLPDLSYEEAYFKRSEVSRLDAINGWWNPDLNVQMGYGLY